jgi:hypothetical protein
MSTLSGAVPSDGAAALLAKVAALEAENASLRVSSKIVDSQLPPAVLALRSAAVSSAAEAAQRDKERFAALAEANRNWKAWDERLREVQPRGGGDEFPMAGDDDSSRWGQAGILSAPEDAETLHLESLMRAASAKFKMADLAATTTRVAAAAAFEALQGQISGMGLSADDIQAWIKGSGGVSP